MRIGKLLLEQNLDLSTLIAPPTVWFKSNKPPAASTDLLNRWTHCSVSCPTADGALLHVTEEVHWDYYWDILQKASQPHSGHKVGQLSCQCVGSHSKAIPQKPNWSGSPVRYRWAGPGRRRRTWAGTAYSSSLLFLSFFSSPFIMFTSESCLVTKVNIHDLSSAFAAG